MAADLVDRIRQDEQIHVASLRLYAGEIRSVRFRTPDGGSIPGAEVIDDWNGYILVSGEQRAINFALLRSMKQAEYSPEDFGHFALAEQDYCHFTSPIRRWR